MALAAASRIASPMARTLDRSPRTAAPSGTSARAMRQFRGAQATYAPPERRQDPTWRRSAAAGRPPSSARPSHRPPGVPAPAGAPPLLRVALVVPGQRLIFGEQLAVVGSCEELGGWDPAKAPRLGWQAGDTWAANIFLPAGSHAFKLAVVRQDGACFFESDGADRQLEVPAGAAAVAVRAGTGLAVTCVYGDTGATDVALATGAELGRLVPSPPPAPAPGTSALTAATPADVAQAPAAAPAPAPAPPAPKMTAREALVRAAALMDGQHQPAAPQPQEQPPQQPAQPQHVPQPQFA